MSSQPGSPSPGPSGPFWIRLLPRASATIFFSLPPAEALRRLLLPDGKEWQVKLHGFSALGQFKLHPHSDGLTLDIDGPYDVRGGPGHYRIVLSAAGSGTTIELANRHAGNPYWGLLIAIVWMVGGTLVFGFPAWMSLLALILVVGLWYVTLRMGVEMGIEVLQNHIFPLLNDIPADSAGV